MYRLIHIPHDESEYALREFTVLNLHPVTLQRALFGDDVTIESIKARGLMHLHDEANRRIVSFLVDEDGKAKDLPFNTRASILYGAHVHGIPVVGDAYVIGEVQQVTADGPEWVWQSVPEHITLATISEAITESAHDIARFRP